MNVPLSVIFAAIAADAFLILACSALVVATRASRLKAERRTAARLGPLRPLLLEVAAEDDPEGESLRRLQGLGDEDWAALAPVAIGLVGKVRGGAKEALASLIDAHGSTGWAFRALFSRRASERARAAEMIGSLGHVELAPRLLPLLKDRRTDVRIVAARALGQLRSPAAASGLIEAAVGRHPVPRGIAAHALLRIGVPACPALTAALSSADWNLRSLAADVLGRIGALSSAGELGKLAGSDPVLAVRVSAVGALGRLGLPGWTGELVQAAGRQHEPQLREVAVEALGSVGTPEAAKALGLLMADPDLRLGARAAARLARLGPLGRAVLEQATAARKASSSEATRAATQARAALALAAIGRVAR